ncbi:MAG: diguanylate cyclase [Desulfovibrio sp.]|nr:MAG: diguanylate cyclase [Desulfovibrio sp.]
MSHTGFDILIVDDEPKNLTVLRRMLGREGYEVRPAISGELALKAVAAKVPDLVLLDIMMPPGMDGFAVCRRLKENPATRNLPVIFISALDDVEDKVKAFETGGVDYITKPFQLEEVLARVRLHLSLLTMRRKLEEQNAHLQQEIAERIRAEQQLTRLAAVDGLTQVANRRHFDEYLAAEWRRHKREKGELALILCDIDHFKRYNDTYGHIAGDECLKAVARAIGSALKRPGDLLARYGGEEFVVLLPLTDLGGAMQVAEAIAREVAILEIDHKSSQVSDHVTLSMGVAVARPGPDNHATLLVAAADAAMYQAKEAGRNCIMRAWENSSDPAMVELAQALKGFDTTK